MSCKHREDNLSYLAWHEDAERRAKRGQKQRLCTECGRWIWGYLWRKTR